MRIETRSEFAELIGLNLSLLKLSGVIPADKSLVGMNVSACVAFACLSVYAVSYSYEFAIRCAYSTGALESFAMIISIVGGQARFSILLLFRDRCRRMLNVCEVLWSTLNPREKEIVRGYARKTKRLTCWYLSSCGFTIFFYAVAALAATWTSSESKPLADGIAGGVAENASVVPEQMRRSTSNERRLPYAFFIDVQETPFYEIAYVLQLFSMVDVGLTCVGADTIGPLFVLIACGHFDAIRSKIERFDPGSNGSPRSISRPASPAPATAAAEVPSAARTNDFRACLTHHRILLELCEDIERLTSGIFLTQLIGSTYNVSLVGFKLVGDDPDKYKYVTQLSIVVFQLFVCNWPADLLLEKSEAIGRAAYFAPWYRYPSWSRLPTNMLLVRARKPVRLTAGKFVLLSLETFASMISSAASFFTVVGGMN